MSISKRCLWGIVCGVLATVFLWGSTANKLAAATTNSQITFWMGYDADPADLKACGFTHAVVPHWGTAYDSKIIQYRNQNTKVIGNITSTQCLSQSYMADTIFTGTATQLTNFNTYFAARTNSFEGTSWDVEFNPFDVLSFDDSSFKYYTQRTGTFTKEQVAFNNPTLTTNIISRWEESDVSIQNTSTYTGTWTANSNTSYSGGGAQYCNATNAKVDIKFNGTAVGLVYKKGVDGGIASVSIDGISYPNIDMYAASTGYQWVRPIASSLSSGSHTLTITNTGTKNASSTGYKVTYDAINLYPPVSDSQVLEDSQNSHHLGYDSSCVKLVQTFTTPSGTPKMSAIAFKLKRIGSDVPVTAGIYTVVSGRPNTLINGTKFGIEPPYGAMANYKLLKVYLPVNLSANTTYAAVLTYSGTPSTTNYYETASSTSPNSGYSGGVAYAGNAIGTSWTADFSDDLEFFIYYAGTGDSDSTLHSDYVDFKCWQVAQCCDLYRGKLKDAAGITEATSDNFLLASGWTARGYLGYSSGYDKLAQTFKPTSRYLKNVKVALKKFADTGTGRPANGMEVSIQTTNDDADHTPTGTKLVTSMLPEIAIAPDYKVLTIPLECYLDTNKTYAIVFDYDGTSYNTNNYYRFTVPSNEYSNGQFLRGSSNTWYAGIGYDIGFELHYLSFTGVAEKTGEDNLGSGIFTTDLILGKDASNSVAEQIFQPMYKYLSGVDFYLKKVGSPPSNLKLAIQGAVYDATAHSYKADGNNLTYCYFAPTSTSYTPVHVDIDCMVDPNKKYALVLSDYTYDPSSYYMLGARPAGINPATGKPYYYNLGNMLTVGTYYMSYCDDIGFKTTYRHFPELYGYTGYQELWHDTAQTVRFNPNHYSADWVYLKSHVDKAMTGYEVPLDTSTLATWTQPLVAPTPLIAGVNSTDTLGVRNAFLRNMGYTGGKGVEHFENPVSTTLHDDGNIPEATEIMTNFENLFMNGTVSYHGTTPNNKISINDTNMQSPLRLFALDQDNERLIIVAPSATAGVSGKTLTIAPITSATQYLKYDGSAKTWSTQSLGGGDYTTIPIDMAAGELNVFYISTDAKLADKLNEINRN